MAADERLQTFFWLSEFLRSDTAVRKGLDNTPGAQQMANIRNILAPGMARVRNLLKSPILITSGYRSPALNAAVGGSHGSAHTQGLACDFVVPEWGTARKVAQELACRAPELRFDQLIWEGQWVHIAYPPVGLQPKGEVLTAHFRGGAVSYSGGIA